MGKRRRRPPVPRNSRGGSPSSRRPTVSQACPMVTDRGAGPAGNAAAGRARRPALALSRGAWCAGGSPCGIGGGSPCGRAASPDGAGCRPRRGRRGGASSPTGAPARPRGGLGVAASPSSSPSGADSSNGTGGGRCHHHAACDAGARRGEGSAATEE